MAAHRQRDERDRVRRGGLSRRRAAGRQRTRGRRRRSGSQLDRRPRCGRELLLLDVTGICRAGTGRRRCSRRRSARSTSMPPARSTGAAAGSAPTTTSPPCAAAYERHHYGAAAPRTLRQRRYACPARAHPATAACAGQGPRALARRTASRIARLRGRRTAARRPGQDPAATCVNCSKSRRRRDRALPVEKHPPRGLESPAVRAGQKTVRLNDPASFSRTGRLRIVPEATTERLLRPGPPDSEMTKGAGPWPRK